MKWVIVSAIMLVGLILSIYGIGGCELVDRKKHWKLHNFLLYHSDEVCMTGFTIGTIAWALILLIVLHIW